MRLASLLALACLGLACSGSRGRPDGSSGPDAARDAGAARDADLPRPPQPARGNCPEGHPPGCAAGFALCGEDRSCPEGQTCLHGLCYLDMEDEVEACRLPEPDPIEPPGCRSGRPCLTGEGRRSGLCVSPDRCRDLPDGWSCRFYDGSPYDGSGWTGECPPSFPDNPYCGGVCGEVVCPPDVLAQALSLLNPRVYVGGFCVGVVRDRPFGVCAGPLTASVPELLHDYQTMDPGRPYAAIELAELPGRYFVVPLVVCLDYQSRVEGVTCVDIDGNPY